MPFLYLFMLPSKVQGAHRCHSTKKLQKKEKKVQQSQYTKDTGLASGLILQSQYSVDTVFTTISL